MAIRSLCPVKRDTALKSVCVPKAHIQGYGLPRPFGARNDAFFACFGVNETVPTLSGLNSSEIDASSAKLLVYFAVGGLRILLSGSIYLGATIIDRVRWGHDPTLHCMTIGIPNSPLNRNLNTFLSHLTPLRHSSCRRGGRVFTSI